MIDTAGKVNDMINPRYEKRIEELEEFFVYYVSTEKE